MFVFEFVIALLLVGAVLSLWSARLGIARPHLSAIHGGGEGHSHFHPLCALAVCGAVMAARIAWWMSHNTLARLRIRFFGERTRRPMMPETLGSGLVISWAGMRGVVTLAAALALPGEFPHRDLIVFCAFSVVLTTLVLQGATLRWLISMVRIPDDGMVDREVGIARAETARATLRAMESEQSPSSSVLRKEYEARLDSGGQQSAGSPPAERSSSSDLQGKVVEAQRQALRDLRDRDVIGEAAFQAAEEELDILELTADPRVRSI